MRKQKAAVFSSRALSALRSPVLRLQLCKQLPHVPQDRSVAAPARGSREGILCCDAAHQPHFCSACGIHRQKTPLQAVEEGVATTGAFRIMTGGAGGGNGGALGRDEEAVKVAKRRF